MVDIGSLNCRAGWGCEAQPEFVFPAADPRSAAAALALQQQQQQQQQQQEQQGTAAQQLPLLFDNVTYPVQRGLVQDWDALERLWQHIFVHKLRVTSASEAPPLVYTDCPTSPDSARERMAELLFEKFDVPAFFVGYQSVMSVYSAGRVSSIVVDIGHGVSHSMAVHEGFAYPHTVERLEVAGQDMTQYLADLLRERGNSGAGASGNTSGNTSGNASAGAAAGAGAGAGGTGAGAGAGSGAGAGAGGSSDANPSSGGSSPLSAAVAMVIKETNPCFATDFAQESMRARMALPKEVFTLPDGQKVCITDEVLRCGELLFQPALCGKRVPGLAERLWETIKMCDSDREGGPMRALPQFILVCGGGSMAAGLEERLQAELVARAGAKRDVFVSCVAEKDRYHAAWIGGSVIASLPSFVENNFVSRAEYKEVGAAVVHKRC